MGKFEAWVGECLIEAEENGQKQNLECFVAVWVQGRKDFEDTLRQHFTDQPLGLLWAEEILPVTGWLQKHGHNNTVMNLAQMVHRDHKVVLGDFTKVVDTTALDSLSGYLTITEHDIPALSDQSSVPPQYQEWIPSELKILLFGQPVNEDILRTYLIVDPTLRKKVTGVFDLDSKQLNVPIQCLFKGEKALELKEAAPYLVDMTLPDGAWGNTGVVPDFHKDFFEHHWQRGTGIIVRSTASMETMFNHFRRFTQYQNDDGKNYFFRFWETNVIYDYFKLVSTMPERAKAFFYTKQGDVVSSLISYAETMARLYEIKPQPSLLEDEAILNTAFTITQPEEQALLAGVLRRHTIQIQSNITARYPDYFSQHNTRELEESILATVLNFHAYGFRNMLYLEELVENRLFWGEDFLEKDTTGELLTIAGSSDHEDVKFNAFMTRLSECEDKMLG